MKKKIGDLTLFKIKAMKKQCENCYCYIDECNKCEKENPSLYALCDIDVNFISEEDLDKEIEVE